MSQKQTKSAAAGPAKEPAKSKPNGADRPATGAELLEALEAEQWAPAKPQSTALRAFRDIIIVAALLAGGVYYYYGYVTVKEEVAKLSVRAADFLQKDDLRSLKEAEKVYLEILSLDHDNPVGLSALAETYFHMTRHGLNKLADAEAYLAKAVSANARAPERFATSAYIKIWKGQAGAAADEVKALLDQDLFSPKLAHAYGWALLEQGDFTRANQVLHQAMESDFTAVRFALTAAETAHRQGRERNAIKNLDKVLSRQMNPDHEIAMAYMAALRAKNYGNLSRPMKLVAEIGKKGELSPAAKSFTAWAEGELNFALQNADVALEKADAAASGYGKPFAPFLDLKARALAAKNKKSEAIAAWEAAIAAQHKYRGIEWALAEYKSKQKDDDALAMIDRLEKSDSTTYGAEYMLFRGEHHLRKGELAKAKDAFTQAADLGNDAEILLGLAKITFIEEKEKGTKADLDKITDSLSTALEARRIFPEGQELYAEINLWNYLVPGASEALKQAEDQYKKLKRPVPEVVEFFDRTIRRFQRANDKQVKKAADEAAAEWEKRKQEYLASVLAGSN